MSLKLNFKQKQKQKKHGKFVTFRFSGFIINQESFSITVVIE